MSINSVVINSSTGISPLRSQSFRRTPSLTSDPALRSAKQVIEVISKSGIPKADEAPTQRREIFWAWIDTVGAVRKAFS